MLLTLLWTSHVIVQPSCGFSVGRHVAQIQQSLGFRPGFVVALAASDTFPAINGEHTPGKQHTPVSVDATKINNAWNDTILNETFPVAPAVTYEKFLTMQEKRVVVTVRYSGESGLRPYFLTVAKKLKQSHPDVFVERRILPPAAAGSDGMDGEATFEILVDGTVVVGRTKARRAKVARVDMSKSRSVFVSMQELDVAISRARRKRRPSSTVYGDEATPGGAVRKEMLRENWSEENIIKDADSFL
jgi:hypothetical protein